MPAQFSYKFLIQIFLLFLIIPQALAYELITDFNTTVNRVTRASDATTYTPAFIRHEYSRRPAFNADSSMAIMYSSNGFFHLYTTNADNTLTYSHILDQIGGGVIEPNWHPTDPNLLYTFNAYGIGMQLNLYDVRNQARINQVDFGNKIKALGGAFATADRAYTGEEGRPSNDGNIWCLGVYSGESWTMVGLIAYDLSLDKIIASREMSIGPDAISTSSSGDFCVTVSGWGGPGIRAYSTNDSNFNTYLQIHQSPEHTDVALDAEGRDVLVYIDSQNDGYVKAIDLQTGRTALLFDTWDAVIPPAAHFSGIGSAQPGWVIVSMYGGTDSSFYYNKVLAVEITQGPQIIVLADTLHTGSNEYFAQPQATVNNQLDKVLFASDASGQISDYMVSIKQSLPVARGIMSAASPDPDDLPEPEPQPVPAPAPTPGPTVPPIPVGLSITAPDEIYFQQDGNITITIQTSITAACRWDYADGNSYPFGALYQNMATENSTTHFFSEYAWSDHTLLLICQSPDGLEASTTLEVSRGTEATQPVTPVTPPAPPAPPTPEPKSLIISTDDIFYFQQDGYITVSVQTNIAAQCRWDYANGNNYPFDVLYQNMTTQDSNNHSLGEFAWNNHSLIVVCKADSNSEASSTILVQRQN